MNLTFLTLLGILRTGGAFILELSAPRNVSKILTVTNGAPWGSWGPPQFCAAGTYAIGYALKMESNQHGGDDTSLNSIQLVCKGLDAERFGGIITSLEGPFGRWSGVDECPRQEGTPRFFSAFALQVESDQRGGDDTAANFLKFQCRDFAGYQRQTELSIYPGHGLFGQLGNWSPSCPASSAICGIRTRVEGNQGGGDDTALNNVIFYCCNEGDF